MSFWWVKGSGLCYILRNQQDFCSCCFISLYWESIYKLSWHSGNGVSAPVRVWLFVNGKPIYQLSLTHSSLVRSSAFRSVDCDWKSSQEKEKNNHLRLSFRWCSCPEIKRFAWHKLYYTYAQLFTDLQQLNEITGVNRPKSVFHAENEKNDGFLWGRKVSSTHSF